MADGRFTPTSTIREVLDGHAEGRRLLYEHGYDVGVGFVDFLSQHQSLLTALRAGRLRDLDGLLQRLNGSPART
ncbi:MAG: hypothetical protein J2P39_14675 [Candidatus Dormibacteraeota bacterium]|nr:hypothetical protein [Candidatus Dormibacteraeota bacterium]